jgi:integrase
MTKVSRGTIRKRTWKWKGCKRVAYFFDVVSNGVRERRQYASQTEAETALDQYREEQRNPQPAGAVEPVQPALTFDQCVERYLAAKVRKKSLSDDRRFLKSLATIWGSLPLSEITTARINAWKSEMLAAVSARGKPFAPGSINRPLQSLRHMLRLAHEEGLLSTVPKIRLEKEPQGRLRWLTEQEIASLLAACSKSRNKQLHAAVVIALNTGLRRGELLALEWQRIDLSRSVIRLEITKSGKRREVPINDACYRALVSLSPQESGHLFDTKTINRSYMNAVESAKLDDVNFHTLRHTFASWAMMRGASLRELQELLGHATLQMTMRYAHLSPDRLRTAVSRLNGLTGSNDQTEGTTEAHEPRNAEELLVNV